MISLRLYFYGFLLFVCFLVISCRSAFAAILPNSIAGVLTAIPYLIAMIFVLFKFLKQQRRAPTLSQLKKTKFSLDLV